MAKDNLLAVAFTDQNGNNKYNPGKDTLIAAIVDTNNDNTVSVGDTIDWGTYPAIPDGSASGTGGEYTSLVTTITNVRFQEDTSVMVDTNLGRVAWTASPNVEQFATIAGFHLVESNLTDSIREPTNEDTIFADRDVAGPGQPNMSVDVSTPQLGDQAFLDVLLLY
jgi:hypothetical protein